MTKYISHLQLRAARNALNLGVKEIADLLKVSKSTISKAERSKTRDFLHKHSAPLIDFFLKNHITFPSEYSIKFNEPNMRELMYDKNSLSRFQLRAARNILNVSQFEFALFLNVDRNIILRMELHKNNEFLRPSNLDLINDIKTFFFEQNIEFPDQFYIYFKKYVDK